MDKYPELIELVRNGRFTIFDIESALKKMKLRIVELENMHQLDQAEIVRLRRFIDNLTEVDK